MLLMIENLVLPAEFCLRFAHKNDDAFLFPLFCSTRTEFSLLPLPPQQLELLLQQQYRLQQAGYAAQYPLAVTLVIEYQSVNIGKIVINKSNASVHVVDFAIVPQYRGCGYGSVILESVKAYAHINGATVCLSVDRQNVRARQLYLRLGFQSSEVTETHEWLLWPPQ
jgi:ribosomal protein S18 acetylase RimI-like enzyme